MAVLTRPEEVEADLAKLFELGGASQYGGEAVTQLEHGLQAALLAEQQGAPSELVVAALLHDIGHLLHLLPDDAPDNGIDDLHETLAAEWLEGRFPREVIEPIRLHVESKRYLSAAEPGYLEALSHPSRVSLALQGGPMSAEERREFEKTPHFEACLQVRRWDDEAKVAGLPTPPLSHFLSHVRSVLSGAATA
jgi:phosphonate degradation associated HDIG domain protein